MAKERFNHLLIARVKDTNMMFSYLFQVQLVPQEPAIQINAGAQIRQMVAGAAKPSSGSGQDGSVGTGPSSTGNSS